jgi:hypothetical protein
MNLQESIRRILREEDYSPAGKEVTPNNIVIHKSNPMFRDKIMENGLKVRAGECYKIYVGYGIKCKPAIFATNSTNKRAWFDSTYDDDIWEINTEMIPDVKWYKDRHFELRSKHIVTFQDIPKEALTLKYKGTGSGDVETWGKDSPNRLEESIRRILKEEVETKKNVIKSMIEKSGLETTARFMGINNIIDIVYDGDLIKFSEDTRTPMAYISSIELNLYLHEALVKKLNFEDAVWRGEKELGNFTFGSKNDIQYKFRANLLPTRLHNQTYYKVVGTSGDSGFGYGYITKRNTLGKRYRQQIFKQIIDKYGLEPYMKVKTFY